MIQVENISRHYGEFTAVNNVNFTIESGEIVGLLGHNGAGKTTIMKMLTGFLEPSTGNIKINGKSLEESPEAARSLMGYLPENSPLYPEMIVADYLQYVAELRGVTQSQQIIAIKTAIAQTGIQEKLFQPISTLSRGYKQRVGVAQAIINQPKILILDEPTNGLDPSQIQHMRNLIKTAGKTSTVILSTHILQEVNAICDRVLIIRNGHLALDSKLADLQKSSKLILKTNKNPNAVKSILQPFQTLNITKHITEFNQHEYIIESTSDRDIHTVTSEVAKQLITQDCEIYTLAPELQDLETVFTDINSKSEVAHAA